MSRVTIGTGGDYPVGENDDAAAAFRAALSAGHRWLVLTGVSAGSNHNLPYLFKTATSGKCVNFDDYREGQSMRLRIEGPGAGLSPIRRAVDATLFYSGGSAESDLSYLTFTGLTFDGADFASPYPLCEFKGIDHSYFEDCEFLDSAADGLSMGGGFQASATRFVHCRFNDNGGNGLTVLKGIDHTFVGGESKNNGRHGIFWQSATAQQGRRQSQRHRRAQRSRHPVDLRRDPCLNTTACG
jgi:hypothetical protein